ncbi:MAG: transposase [Microcystis aeruginosa]
MPRKKRELQAGNCYHVTVRCNNREFKLLRHECREVFLYVLKRSLEKYTYKLYAVCIMSNHVHYLIEPQEPADLPKIMHYINWFTAMCFNRMLNRTGHFWEKRYFSSGFPTSDYKRALNTLRYIHANPKAAGIQQGFFYDFSNYGIHDRLSDDGLTQWHPAFLSLGKSLDDCAKNYRKFCKKYKPQPKPEKRSYWGSKFLPKVLKIKDKKRHSPGQLKLWDEWEPDHSLVREVAEKFVMANCYDPKVASQFFNNS